MLVTCKKCGWVSFAVSQAEAEKQVNKFNTWYDAQGEDIKDSYGRRASLGDYACLFCGGRGFRPAEPDDCLDGCTVSPVIYELLPKD